jgi:hypothetical protein
MDTTFWLLLVLTVTMVGVAWHSRRIGNERRDVVLLSAVAGLFCVGSGLAAVF